MKPKWGAIVGGLVIVAVLAYAVLWVTARLKDANPDPRTRRVPPPRRITPSLRRKTSCIPS